MWFGEMPMPTFILPTGQIKKRKPGRQSQSSNLFSDILLWLNLTLSMTTFGPGGSSTINLLKVPHSSLCCLISAAALDEFPALDSCFFYVAGPGWCCPPPYSLPVDFSLFLRPAISLVSHQSSYLE